jgi:hypothetical protein
MCDSEVTCAGYLGGQDNNVDGCQRKQLMNPETSPPSSPTARNRPAQASLVIALIFLIQCVAFLVINLIARSPGGTRFIKTNPNHPLVGLVEAVVELSLVFVPLDLLAGALAIVFGTFGLRASRRLPGECGRSKSMTGIVMGVLLLVLPFVVIFSWASGWRQ